MLEHVHAAYSLMNLVFSPKDASLYPMGLSYFSSSPEVLAKSRQELLSVMKHIDEKDLLPPIQVVQALSRSNVASIGLIKDYIGKKIEYERKELKQVSQSTLTLFMTNNKCKHKE